MLLEVSTHGSVLKRDHESFLVKSGGETHEVLAEKLTAIVVSANALVSTQAIRLAMEKQIQVVFTSRSGKPFARVWASTQGRATGLRRWQYMNQDTLVGGRIAIDITRKKIRRQKAALVKMASGRSSPPNDVVVAITILDEVLARITNDSSKSKLLGLEGWAAREYFRVIALLVPEKWRFKARSQHPALDSFNAVLNYMYGIAYADVERIIILSGLDPAAGFYHADSYGKPTLSYDLIEVSRALIDRAAVSLFSKRIAKDGWFEAVDGAVYLSKSGRAAVLARYMEACRKAVESETWKYCRQIVKEYGRLAT